MSKIPGARLLFSCAECKKVGNYILHTALTRNAFDEAAPWSWELLNHNGTSKFRWPKDFESKEAAQGHINKMLGDDVV